MNVLTVVGNRPQFIKAAAVSAPLRHSEQELLIHTGQHFDEELSGVFFDELGLPSPDKELGIARGSNASQTARMVAALEPLIADASPDVVMIYGDTNSTLAGALAGAQAGVPVAHVEAGMRSFDRTMPEELNRVLADHASALLLCSSEVAVSNLQREGIRGAVELVGDVMVDVAMKIQPSARGRVDIVRSHGLTEGEYVLATAHRPGNVDDPKRLARLVELLLAVPYRVLLPLHPRTHGRLRAAGLLERLQRSEGLVVTPPLGYLELTALLCNARAVITDSGGLQKEAYLAGVACITLRTTTEWVETVEQGWNVLVDLDVGGVLQALERQPPPERPPLYGDGRAADRVVAALRLHLA
jgi:UDP-N-acetylglucosamine 2-epimerase (non-hydrolysing)/UDP-GlcNAc3NAcA epimerase